VDIFVYGRAWASPPRPGDATTLEFAEKERRTKSAAAVFDSGIEVTGVRNCHLALLDYNNNAGSSIRV
jgi:hypothetical protein